MQSCRSASCYLPPHETTPNVLVLSAATAVAFTCVRAAQPATSPATPTEEIRPATPSAAPGTAKPKVKKPKNPNDPDEAAEEVVALSPFTVSDTDDKSWQATTTLIGSRTNQELIKVPINVDVITAEFMRDLGAFSMDVDAARFVVESTSRPGSVAQRRTHQLPRPEHGRCVAQFLHVACPVGRLQR